MVALIAACEIGFWICLALGLVTRYLLRARRLSAIVLLCAPALDVLLLAATAISLRSGTPPSWEHALAAIYLGFSIAYGHRMIQWADVRFAHYFANGPAPKKLLGRAYARQCWNDVARTGLAAVIACAVTAVLTTLAKPGTNTLPLTGNYRWMSIICALEVIWALSYTVKPRR